MGVAKRSLESVGWNAGASLLSTAILFLRAIFLARLLEVDTFGNYVWAGAFVSLTVIFVGFGMGAAFVSRASASDDESLVAAVHFTLKLIFTVAWIVCLVTYALIFTEGDTRTALLVLTSTTAVLQMCQTPRLILVKRVAHRRIALNEIAVAIVTTAVALALAFRGYGLWTLLATDVVIALLTFFNLYVWKPVWRVSLAWNPEIARYFLHMGRRTLPTTLLLQVLDKVDDLWVGRFLGATELGYYSRAYKFATYPRLILAKPVNNVAIGTYAEVQQDRLRLSQAFFRSNAVLVRIGFLFAGALALMAPELIALLLGEKWQPMLDIFRLMLIYTLLDPIKLTVSNLFLAVGNPEPVVKTRSVQLVVMLVGLFTLGFRFGTVGVALTVNLMLIVGMTILFRKARQYVDFSLRALFLVPFVGLCVAMAVTLAVVTYGLGGASLWLIFAAKGIVFPATYCVILLLEKGNLRLLRQLIARYGAQRP